MSPRPNPRSLFLGHGAPTLALSTHPATEAMRAVGRRLAAPRALIVVSPHRYAAGFDVGASARFEAWHDFRGFPAELYEIQYAPPGDPALAARVSAAIRAEGLPSQLSDDARIDHGIWVPLRLMWPAADVPVIPVASTRAGPEPHLALGRALKPFADQGCLVIGTGSITHNLGDLDFGNEYAPVQPWAQAFDDWIADGLIDRDPDALARYRREAPHAVHAHPTDEHLMPLFVALAAGGAAEPTFRGFSHGTISLSAYEFA